MIKRSAMLWKSVVKVTITATLLLSCVWAIFLSTSCDATGCELKRAPVRMRRPWARTDVLNTKFCGGGQLIPYSSAQVDELLSSCDLSPGLSVGHQNSKPGHTFFTFDPTVDKHVSHGMISNGGLYDAHVHAALDFAFRELKSSGVTCNGQNVVLDVGSNLGSLALYSASRGCDTHASEIQPGVACRLKMSALASGLELHIHRKAVHSQSGRLFKVGSNAENPGGVSLGSPADENAYGAVESVRLDDMFPPPNFSVLFMKVDTEGNEFEVLKSAEALLSQRLIQYMVIEIRPTQVEMVDFLYAHGHSCEFIRDARSRAAITCRGRSAPQIKAEMRSIQYFSDIFCCL